MRVVALIVVAVFAPQQIAWAVDYDWRSMWRASQPQTTVTAAAGVLPRAYLKSAGFEKQIAFNVKESLESLRRSNSPAIQFSNNVVVERANRSAITKDEIENAYKKLVDSRNDIVTCGAYSLYNLFTAYGITGSTYEVEREVGQGPSILDIANTLILIDLLSSPKLIPTFNKNQLEISFYSLIKAAEIYGLELQPFYFSTYKTDLESITKHISLPFIATIDEPHTVLVKSVDKKGVLIIDNDEEKLISVEEFKNRSMGYCLAVDVAAGEGIENISEEFAKSIKIKSRSRKNKIPGFNELFPEPDPWDQLISLGLTIGLSAIPGGKSAADSTFGDRLIKNIIISNISKAATQLAIQEFKWSPEGAQVFGYVIGGGFGGLTGPNASLQNFFKGAIQGGIQGGSSLLAYKLLQNTALFTDPDLRPIGQSLVSIMSNSLTYVSMSAINNIANGNPAFQNVFSGAKGNPMSEWGRFRSYLISEGIGTLLEYGAVKAGLDINYTRALSVPIRGIAGMIGTGETINFSEDILPIILQTGVSIGLDNLGGKFDSVTGKNKWGLTALQMHLLTFTGAALLNGVLATTGITGANLTPRETYANMAIKGAYGDKGAGNLWELSNKPNFWGGVLMSLATLRDNMDMGEFNADTWNNIQVLEKMSQFSGIATLTSSADYMMKGYGYNSWKEFIADNHSYEIFPSMAYSGVEYVSSALLRTSAQLTAHKLYAPVRQIEVKRITEVTIALSAIQILDSNNQINENLTKKLQEQGLMPQFNMESGVIMIGNEVVGKFDQDCSSLTEIKGVNFNKNITDETGNVIIAENNEYNIKFEAKNGPPLVCGKQLESLKNTPHITIVGLSLDVKQENSQPKVVKVDEDKSKVYGVTYEKHGGLLGLIFGKGSHAPVEQYVGIYGEGLPIISARTERFKTDIPANDGKSRVIKGEMWKIVSHAAQISQAAGIHNGTMAFDFQAFNNEINNAIKNNDLIGASLAVGKGYKKTQVLVDKKPDAGTILGLPMVKGQLQAVISFNEAAGYNTEEKANTQKKQKKNEENLEVNISQLPTQPAWNLG